MFLLYPQNNDIIKYFIFWLEFNFSLFNGKQVSLHITEKMDLIKTLIKKKIKILPFVFFKQKSIKKLFNHWFGTNLFMAVINQLLLAK